MTTEYANALRDYAYRLSALYTDIGNARYMLSCEEAAELKSSIARLDEALRNADWALKWVNDAIAAIPQARTVTS